MRTDSRLMARLRNPADDAAWREFDRAYGSLIARYAMRRGLRLADAEDVRQDVLVRLVRRFPGFVYDRDRGRFRGYLATTTRRAIARQVRRRGPSRAPLEAVAPADTAKSDWVEECRRHALRQAVGRLRATSSSLSNEVFDLLQRGLTPGQVAEALQVSRDAVYKMRERSLRRLGQLYEECRVDG